MRGRSESLRAISLERCIGNNEPDPAGEAFRQRYHSLRLDACSYADDALTRGRAQKIVGLRPSAPGTPSPQGSTRLSVAMIVGPLCRLARTSHRLACPMFGSHNTSPESRACLRVSFSQICPFTQPTGWVPRHRHVTSTGPPVSWHGSETLPAERVGRGRSRGRARRGKTDAIRPG